MNDTASVRADVDAAVQPGITGDVQQQTPLVLIVIDANPGEKVPDTFSPLFPPRSESLQWVFAPRHCHNQSEYNSK
jgi:hypothetical protein